MTKAPRLSVGKPSGSGALRLKPKRGANGKFVSRKDEPTPVAKPAKPASRKRAIAPALLVARVTRAIERELSQIEEIVGQAAPGTKIKDRTEADKRARTLASLARTLAEVLRLRDLAHEPKADHDDAIPRDLDDFRATLERRLARLVDPAEDAIDRADDAA